MQIPSSLGSKRSSSFQYCSLPLSKANDSMFLCFALWLTVAAWGCTRHRAAWMCGSVWALGEAVLTNSMDLSVPSSNNYSPSSRMWERGCCSGLSVSLCVASTPKCTICFCIQSGWTVTLTLNKLVCSCSRSAGHTAGRRCLFSAFGLLHWSNSEGFKLIQSAIVFRKY